MTDLAIVKGSTFTRTIRWETLPLVYTPITAISKSAPVVIASAGHGLKDGWRAAVASPGGMRQIKAKSSPPRESDMHRVTVLTTDTVSFNDVDSTNFTTYTSGGSLVSYTPMSLAGASARMQIRETAEATGDPLVSLVSPTDIVLDDTAHTVTLTIAATATAAFDWEVGVYDLEIIAADETVTKILAGNVVVTDEVTR